MIKKTCMKEKKMTKPTNSRLIAIHITQDFLKSVDAALDDLDDEAIETMLCTIIGLTAIMTHNPKRIMSNVARGLTKALEASISTVDGETVNPTTAGEPVGCNEA